MDHRVRQQRPRGYNDPGHAHELTFSCFHRYPFLSKDRTCEWLAQAVEAARKDLDYALWAYVFMPDHVHLIIWPRQHVYNDSEFLKAIKEPVGREAVSFLKRNAPEWLERIRVTRGTKIEHHFWQPGRGHDRNITSARTLQAMIDYIHLNPVRRGLVERAADWKWSSAGWFAGQPLNDLAPDPIPWDWLETIG
jgi:putative transposase